MRQPARGPRLRIAPRFGIAPRLRIAPAALLASVTLALGSMPFAVPVVAHDGGDAAVLDVDPETESGPVGTTCTIDATVYDDDGDLLTGPGSDTLVKFYFVWGSPNDPQDGLTPDLTCQTGTEGECSVTYTALEAGTDTICALAGPWWECLESVGAPEMDDLADM